MATPAALVKAILVGRPKATEHLEHERLPKTLALAVFSSDALSSSAYATEEILLVLVAGGLAALRYSIPIAGAITLVLLAVVFSYRQTVHAYPQGGGSYIVARENLGKYPGLVAAAAILTDYVLTVAVSVSAGVFAVVSAAPSLHRFRVPMALAVILVMTLLNLRGVRESGVIFAVPTYAFVVLLGATLVWGFARYFLYGYRPAAPSAEIAATSGLSLFLLLRAFSNGSTALTGVEAIADGVAAFKAPEARNAARTLTTMALILGFLFVGLTVMAHLYHVYAPTEDPHRTVVALIALRVYGAASPLFYAVQAATALILFLAANTAYSDFPRLSAILARDRFAPSQMKTRGDRLSFSNGILALGGLAAVLIIVYSAEYSDIINMYVVGVFTAFTLSQAGMVARWRNLRASEPKWRRSAAVNGFGATATFVVLMIVIRTKLLAGAWIVVTAIPLLVAWFDTVHRHYARVSLLLRDPTRRVTRTLRHHVILLIGWPSEEERRALEYAHLLRPSELVCVHFSSPAESPGVIQAWAKVLGSAPSLQIVPSRSSLAGDLREYVEQQRARIDPSEFLTVVIPEVVRPGLLGMLRGRSVLLAKAALLFTPNVVVTDVPMLERETRPWTNQRHVVIVLVSAVHNATMLALDYALSMRADEVRAVHVAGDPQEAALVTRDWEMWRPARPLEHVPDPYRELVAPLRDYVRTLVSPGDTSVTLLIPEFIVGRWWHHLLHNGNPLRLKRAFLSEPGVVVTSVPYKID